MCCFLKFLNKKKFSCQQSQLFEILLYNINLDDYVVFQNKSILLSEVPNLPSSSVAAGHGVHRGRHGGGQKHPPGVQTPHGHFQGNSLRRYAWKVRKTPATLWMGWWVKKY